MKFIPQLKMHIQFKSLTISLLALCMLLGVSAFGQTRHYLIAGSFNNLRAANDFSEAMSIKGYSPQVIFSGNNGNQYRVSIYQSVNKNEVSQYRQQLPGSGKSYWILSMGTPGNRQNVLPPANRAPGVAPAPSGVRYHLVVGSFSSKEAADRSIAAKMSQGFDAYLIPPADGSGQFRVAVMNSMDKKEVQTYQRMLKKSGQNPGMIVEEGGSLTSNPGNGNSSNFKIGQTGSTFHLIDGSFATYHQAARHEQELRQKGHDAIVLVPASSGSSRYRVSAYRSNNRSEVVSYQRRFTQNGKKMGWILAL